jgi:HEPN domain-containing protein
MAGITRAEWQTLAEDRLLDAQALLAAGRWSAAYYLAGYAVECGLKACIVKRVAAEPEIVFGERRFSDKIYSHTFEVLVEQAGLKAQLAADRLANKALEDNWDRVEQWTESARYAQASQAAAVALVDAVADLTNGVLQWMRSRW